MLLSLSGSAYLCGGRLSDLTQQVCHMIHMRIDSSFYSVEALSSVRRDAEAASKCL